ncbi:MAG: hypothetical protein H6559_27990 [Lewinellaceae bacterium]|nr:hypothetical protein [Lewinellaceae bacterium]
MNSTFLEKVRKLCSAWESQGGAPMPEMPEEQEGDGLEDLFRRLEEASYRKQPVRDDGRNTELAELANTFSLEELAGFLRALLLEDPGLMELPLFPETRHVSKSEAAYDWLMNLPYSTLAKARDIFVSLFEAALRNELGSGSLDVIQKLKALTAKNHAGLPFEYLERKVRSGDLAPALRLDLAQLMVLHEKYDLDFAASESLFSTEDAPYMLPALMAAYLRAGLEGAKQALRALNQSGEKDFPVQGLELRPAMAFMLEEAARAFRKAYPADWQERLASFADAELEIRNGWLRGLVAEELGVEVTGKQNRQGEEGKSSSLEKQKKAGQAKTETSGPPHPSISQKGAAFSEPFDFTTEPAPALMRRWAMAAMADKGKRGELYEAIAREVRKDNERGEKNARAILIYLKDNSSVDLSGELQGWKLKFIPDPYRLVDLRKYPELETSKAENEFQEDESKVIGKAMSEAEEHGKLEFIPG